MDSVPLQSFVLGFLPGAFWLWFIHRRDDHEPEPWSIVLIVFALGGLSTSLVLWTRPWLEAQLLPAEGHWGRSVADAFLVTAPLEETIKMLAFVAGVAWHRELDEPLDGIIYGSAAGLGFASVENAFYLAGESGTTAQLEVMGIRAFTATLVHVSCTATVGFFLGMMRFVRPGTGRGLWLLGLGIAIVLHGLYDVFLLAGGRGGWVSVLVVLPVMLLFFSLKLHWARGQSEEFHDRGA